MASKSFVDCSKFLLLVIVVVSTCVVLQCQGQQQFGQNIGQRQQIRLGAWEPIDLENASTQEMEQLNSTATFALEQIDNQLLTGEFSQDPMPDGSLNFEDILSAWKQVVSGINYNLTILTMDDNGTDFLYNVIVFTAPWQTPPMSLTQVSLV